MNIAPIAPVSTRARLPSILWLLALASPPVIALAQEATLPTVVIHGTKDLMCHPSGGRATAAAIPGARLSRRPHTQTPRLAVHAAGAGRCPAAPRGACPQRPGAGPAQG